MISDVERGVITDQFYAERIYTRRKLALLLKTQGFGYITTHGELSPDSERHQDLGMMARRVVITAEARKIAHCPANELMHWSTGQPLAIEQKERRGRLYE